MSSNVWDEAVAAQDALDAALARCAAVDTAALTNPQRLALLARREEVRRALPSLDHCLINQLDSCAGVDELGGKLSHALATLLRISRTEAARRIAEADDLGNRIATTGEELPPRLAATAAGVRAGRIGAEHVRIIRGFLHRLPEAVDAVARERAEADLARYAEEFRPEQLHKLAERLNTRLVLQQ